MNKLQDKQTGRPARSQQPLARNNKYLPRNSKPKPSKDKAPKPQHKYPTRCNTKNQLNKPLPKVEEALQKTQP
jgi:hypothetical protein